MPRTVKDLVLDVLSAVVLGLGLVGLVLPLVLSLGLGANKTAYFTIGEWAGGQSNTLIQLGIGPMLGMGGLLGSCLIIGAGIALRLLYWRRSTSDATLHFENMRGNDNW